MCCRTSASFTPPKLDEGQEEYVEKLKALIDEAKINTLTVMIMKVPCCRGLAGLARTGSAMTNGSGDYVIAFSTVPVTELAARCPVGNERMSPLFEAVSEATEEAVYNSLFLATSVRGADRTVEALPIAATLDVLRCHGAVR